MKIICDSCGTKYSISDDKVRGKVFKIRCKKCSHIIVVRGGETQEEAAAPAAAEGGWHIVVEGEQVGPISEADVRARVERGEIRADTYIWKEGFADWLKLSAVPEFADLAPADSGSVSIGDVFASDGAVQPTNGSSDRSGGRRRSGAARPLFGDGGGDADVFAAPAAAAPRFGRRSVRIGGRAFDRVERAALAVVGRRWWRRVHGRPRRWPRRQPDRSAPRELGAVFALQSAVARDAERQAVVDGFAGPGPARPRPKARA